MERSNTAVRRLAVAGGLLAVILSAGACDPGPTPPPTPPATPTTTTQPTATPTPTPSQSSSAEVRKAEYDKAVAASIEAVNKMNILLDDAFIRGDTRLPTALDDYLAPDGEIHRWQQDGLDRMRQKGWRFDRQSTLKAVWPQTPVSQFDGTSLIVYLCVDARAVNTVDSTGKIVATGELVAGLIEMQKSQLGRWRGVVFANPGDIVGLPVVASCMEGPQ